MNITESDAVLILQMIEVCDYEETGPDGLPLALRIVRAFPQLYYPYIQDLGLIDRYDKWRLEEDVSIINSCIHDDSFPPSDS
mgnify:CR=1 FL=1